MPPKDLLGQAATRLRLRSPSVIIGCLLDGRCAADGALRIWRIAIWPSASTRPCCRSPGSVSQTGRGEARSSRDPSQRTTAHSAWKPSCGGSPNSRQLISGVFNGISSFSSSGSNRRVCRWRPMFHWTSRRIEAHVKLCVLALQVQRAAEIRCQLPWARIAHVLSGLKAVRYRCEGRGIVQRSKITADLSAMLKSLTVSVPKQILLVEEFAFGTCRDLGTRPQSVHRKRLRCLRNSGRLPNYREPRPWHAPGLRHRL